MNGINVVEIFEKLFPQNLAYEWDNIGLQIGNLDKEVSNILLTLDLTLEVVDEAINKKVDLIIVHHPLIFTPLKAINTNTYIGKIIEKLLKSDIALFVAHTNFDIGEHGMNTILANMIQLKDQEILEYVTESLGLGKIGNITPIIASEFILDIKRIFSVENARFIGDLNASIKRVAITGGSGSSTIVSAKIAKADILITGDISYHQALDSLSLGVNVLDIGHNIEKFFVFELKNILEKSGVLSNILISEVDTNPYKFV